MPLGIKRPRTAIATGLVALFDSLLGGLSMYGVMRLRYIYEGKMAPNNIDVKAAVVFGIICFGLWLGLRIHRAVWRYTSLDDIGPLLRAVVLAAILTPLVLFLVFDRAADFPRSAPFLVVPFFLLLLIISRTAVLLFYQRDLKVLFRRRDAGAKRAVLIGRSNSLHDGDTGLMKFEANDLIGRNAKDLDVTPVRQFVEGKKVLITGAGGTIGSELTLQISRLRPAKIILIDNGEFNLYKIDRALNEHKLCKWHSYLGDIQDETRMREIFEFERPDIVLHAAALKHVPLSELNPVETINSNVGGTYNIIKLATEYNTDSFTLVSTDKAVKPSNIMGATKRIAEMATLAAATQSPSLSACTVTHKDATRFFMTTEEAAALVLQASALSAMQRKEMAAIYVLDMGEPVSITQLARQLIRLRGYVPDRDIDIVYTGLRPGEKLTEVLTGVREDLAPTYVDGVNRFTGRLVDPKSVTRRIEALLRAAEDRDKPAMITALSKLLPEYEPNGTLHERV